MYQMFFECFALTTIPNMDQWDVSQVTNMSQMFWMQFNTTNKFNQPLNGWGSKTHNVKDMSFMFNSLVLFDQPLDQWDVSSVQDMGNMFSQAKTFNQNLNWWNVHNVTNMTAMFLGATSFHNTIRNWDLTSISDPANGINAMLDGTAIDCSVYSGILVDWAAGLGTTTPNNLIFGVVGDGTVTYSPDASVAHGNLVAAGWGITDGGQGSCSVPLPISLQSFTVQPEDNNKAFLQWTTASETGNKGFYVQRSADGASWIELTFVNSAASGGNSSAQINYQYTDNIPLAGENYYRLKQVDINGTANYSAVQGINFSNLATAMQVSPNPTTGNIKISNLPANATVRIVSINGSIYNLPVNNGNIDVSRLPAGIYFAQVIVSNSITGTLKFVKE
jgi:surface protein